MRKDTIVENLIGGALLYPKETNPTLTAGLMEIHTLVCKRMFCPSCEKILDTYKSVIVNTSKEIVVLCGDCWDETCKRVKKADPNQSTEQGMGTGRLDFRCYDKHGRLKKTPRGGKKPKPRANIRLGDKPKGLESVEYSKRFEGSGFTWFIHGKKTDWIISSWDCGLRLGVFDTQKEGIAAARSLNDDEINIVKGSISLHGGANEPVKGGKS